MRPEAGWFSSPARNLKTSTATSSVPVTWLSRPARCLPTLGRALAAADARPDQVTKITIFVVGYRRDECLPTIEEGRVALFGDHKPADTLVGVEALSPGYLIEVEAIAVVDG